MTRVVVALVEALSKRRNTASLQAQARNVRSQKIDKEEFDFFVENQKRDLRVFVDSQPAQEQERAEKLTFHVLELAATKVVPVLIAMI